MHLFSAPGKITPHKTVADGPFLYYKMCGLGYLVRTYPTYKLQTWGIPSADQIPHIISLKWSAHLPHMGYSVRPHIYPTWGIPSADQIPHIISYNGPHIYPTWGIPSVRTFTPHYKRCPHILPHKHGVFHPLTIYPTL